MPPEEKPAHRLDVTRGVSSVPSGCPRVDYPCFTKFVIGVSRSILRNCDFSAHTAATSDVTPGM